MAQRTRPSTDLATPNSTPETGLPPIVRYWVLRILVELKADQQFAGRHGVRDHDVALQIGLGQCVSADQFDDLEPSVIRQHLRQLYRDAQKEPRSIPPVLAANVQRIAALVGLSELEMRIFEFTVLMRAYAALREVCEKPSNLRSRQLADRIAVLLDLPPQDVWEALRPHSRLTRSGLMSLSRHSRYGSIEDRLELISESLPDRLTESIVEPTDWLRDMVRAGQSSHLQWTDYVHLDKPLSVLRPYLRQALQQGRAGVNIFLYGPPGTGKTQLARLLAQDMGCELFEITTEDEDKDPIDGRKRVKAHCAANSFFARQRALILFDEVEEVFSDGERTSFMSMIKGDSQQHSRKGWMNTVLETNALPTIWVANSLRGLDPAFVRRFDMMMELPVPPRSHRQRIIRQTGGELLSDAVVVRLAESEHLAPAVLAKAVDVVGLVASELGGSPAEAVQMLVNNTLQAQGHRAVREHNPDALPEHYDPAFIHADVNLAEVAQLLQTARTGRLCLYGLPGTGKTAYGRWLAQQLGVPLHVRRASDLLGMYVGENEKNIARAFAEAEADGGVLLIDEVDSFLQDRKSAERSWEISLVNEMLTQMEAFSGVFIASTNLMDQLDPAVLRRFDLKVRFDPLRPEQAAELLRRHCAQQGLPEPDAQALQGLSNQKMLTPGDYAAVQRQSRLRPLRSAGDWVRALQAECALKPRAKSSGMGFI